MEDPFMTHPIKPNTLERGPRSARRDAAQPPAWPQFAGVSQLVGTSPSGRVTVYVDPTLGDQGLQNAHDLLADADRVAAANDQIFGTVGQPVSVIVYALSGATDGTGGADHGACDYVNGAAIEVCASFGNSARVSALFEAELSECSMGGNLCGVSTGEALSRWCAAQIGNNALADFASAPAWYTGGQPDYVDQTYPTDSDYPSIGCGMAFISWLLSKGYGLPAIAEEMVALGDAGTLAQAYAALSGDAVGNAWPNFSAAVQALQNGVTSDDPFGGGGQPAHLAHATPMTVELAGKIFASILADLSAGKADKDIVAGVRGLMAAAKRPGVRAAQCSTRSHPLRPQRKTPA
jgi:hypothetical protein